jgi:hypothetical protein
MGLTIGVSGNDAHRPSASRFALEYIGRKVNLRKAISDCGLFEAHDPAVPRAIADYLGQFGEPAVPGQLQAYPL